MKKLNDAPAEEQVTEAQAQAGGAESAAAGVAEGADTSTIIITKDSDKNNSGSRGSGDNWTVEKCGAADNDVDAIENDELDEELARCLAKLRNDLPPDASRLSGTKWLAHILSPKTYMSPAVILSNEAISEIRATDAAQEEERRAQAQEKAEAQLGGFQSNKGLRDSPVSILAVPGTGLSPDSGAGIAIGSKFETRRTLLGEPRPATEIAEGCVLQ